MTSIIDLSSEQRELLLALLHQYIPGIEVWAYGSRVKLTARRNSDLDLVAFAAPENERRISELKDVLTESDLPFLVDLHIWGAIPEQFHETIRNKHVVLQRNDCDSDDAELPSARV